MHLLKNTPHVHIHARVRALEKNTQSEKDKKGAGVSIRSWKSAMSTCCTPRERRRGERTIFESEYMPTLGPNTCPSKIFSLLDDATICICSFSLYSARPEESAMDSSTLRFSGYEFNRERGRGSSSSVKSQRCAMNFLLAVLPC